MMNPMTAMLVGVFALIMLPLTKSLHAWVALRGRAQLVRATAQLSPGAHVQGHDTAGFWSAGCHKKKAR